MRLSEYFDLARQVLRGFLLTCRIRIRGGKAGRWLKVERHVLLRRPPHKGWSLGEHVYLGQGVVLDIENGATFVIEDRARIMHYVVIGAGERLTIGARTQVAEHCSVRDGNHTTTLGTDMRDAAVIASPVSIGAGAWVGRGSAILAGATVGDGAVIGANSVVRGHVPADEIHAGSPAKYIRNR